MIMNGPLEFSGILYTIGEIFKSQLGAVWEEIARVPTGNKQTNRQTNRQSKSFSYIYIDNL